jgi:hypothetical protein
MRLLIKSDGTASNYWYVQLTLGAPGSLQIYKMVSGTATQLASSSHIFSAGTTYTIFVCYGDGHLYAYESVTNTTVSANVTTNISTQLYAGLSCGSITANVQFANFTYKHGYDVTNYPTCVTCPICSSTNSGCWVGGSSPTQLDVVLPSSFWVAGTCGAGQCESVSGLTYTLSRVFDGACAEYTYNSSPTTICSGQIFQIQVDVCCLPSNVASGIGPPALPNSCRIYLQVFLNVGANTLVGYYVDVPGKLDPATFTQNLTLYSGGGGGTLCVADATIKPTVQHH